MPIVKIEDVLKEMRDTEIRDAEVGPESPEHSEMFTLTDTILKIYWGNYEYEIALDRINDPHKALNWIKHLTEKEWKHTTPARIHLLLEHLYARNGWQQDV